MQDYDIHTQAHMIKSKIEFSGFMIMIILIMYGIGLSIYKYYVDQALSLTLISNLILLLLISISVFLKVTKNIKIENTRITFSNWLTNRSISYSFDELDGYIELQLPSYGGSYPSILLVKGGKWIGQISSSSYANYLELKSGLRKLNYFGSKSVSPMIGYFEPPSLQS